VQQLNSESSSSEDGSSTAAQVPASAAEAITPSDAAAAEGLDLRETYRQQLIESVGGWQGTVIAAVAPIVFVIVNATAGLRPAIIAAIATSLVLTGYRLVRKQSVQQALSGLLGVVVAALIAARTGQARGYFLLGIWQSFIYAVPFALSIPFRRPLVGWIWEFLDPTPPRPGEPETAWHRRKGLLGAYMIATAVAIM
jgi:MFS family permease